MKTPKHWRTRNFLSTVLYLPSCLYALATWCRVKFIKPRKVSVPVVCIGNLTAGGSGKTPTALSLAGFLKGLGKHPWFVSRGYGGSLQGAIVDETVHTPAEVGDEPLLLNCAAPVVVNHKRYEAACMAVDNGADVILMDDGFQNPVLYKDMSFLVIDGAVGMGNLCPIPAGPMREFLSQGLKRAQAVILLGEDECGILPKLKGLPVFRGDIVPMKPKLATARVVAFAGIGRPQKFYQSLQDCGLILVKTVDFPDHHFYTRTELEALIAEAKAQDAALITTSKDMVKIPHDLQPMFNVLEIGIKWRDEAALLSFLRTLF